MRHRPRHLALLAAVACALPLVTPPAAALPVTIRARTSLELRTERASDGLHLRGRLLDDQGAPVASELVHLTVRGLDPQTVRSGPNGNFELLIRSADLQTVESRHGTRLPWEARFTGDSSYGGATSTGVLDLRREATWLDLEVEPPIVSLDAERVMVHATLRTAEGPVGHSPIRIQVADGPELLGDTDPSGRATFLIRPALLHGPGRFAVRSRFVGDPRHAPAEATAELRILLATRVTLRVGREGGAATGRYRFSGRLIDDDGALAGATIGIVVSAPGQTAEEFRTVAVTDAAGIYLTAINARDLFADAEDALEIRAVHQPTDGRHLASVSRPVVVRVPPPPGIPTRWYLAGLLWLLAGMALTHIIRNRLWRQLLDRLRRRREPPPLPPLPEEPPNVLDPPLVTAPAAADAPRRPRWIGGEVLDAHTAERLAGVEVVLIGGEIEHAATSDAAGRFELGPLAPGRWRLRMRAEGYLPRETDVAVPHAGDLDGAGFALISVAGRVRDLYATALARYEARLRWGWNTPREAFDDARAADITTRRTLGQLRLMTEEAYYAAGPVEAALAAEAQRLLDDLAAGPR